MGDNIRVGIVFGGRSAEHEVSLQSAKNIIYAIDSKKYDTVLIGIDRNGGWFLNDDAIPMLDSSDPRNIRLKASKKQVTLVSGNNRGQMLTLSTASPPEAIDVLFPVLHGPYGEDGSVQGLARLANVPCVGAAVLGSAIGMDKDVSNRLLRSAGIQIADFLVVRAGDYSEEDAVIIGDTLGYPLFVKPANMGSSVGVSKADGLNELQVAIRAAFAYDIKVVIESTVVGREIECAILGNDKPLASIPGEIIPNDEFYSYDAKYIDENGASLEIPAKLDAATVRRVQDTAIQAFQVLECSGMARVDMFLTDDGQILVNEINTIPGFTKISMYPLLWEASGISYTDLIDRLIQFAIEDFEMKSILKTER